MKVLLLLHLVGCAYALTGLRNHPSLKSFVEPNSNEFINFRQLSSCTDSDLFVQLGDDIDSEADDDEAGTSVSLSSDGLTVAIGAPKNDGNAGHVRVFEYDGSNWSQKGADIDGETSNDESGSSVSLSADGKIVAIGAKGNGAFRGHVRVYEHDGTTWNQLGSDINGESMSDNSGHSISLSSDGKIVAIGAYRNDDSGSNAGHVRVYEYTGSSWSQVGADIDGEAPGDESGYSVSLSSDGKIVAIGGTQNDNDDNAGVGYVRVYEYNGSDWTQIGSDIDGDKDVERSGHSVSLSADGKIVAIGSPDYDGNRKQEGRTRVFEYNGSEWSQKGSTLDGNCGYDCKSGDSVRLSGDGRILALGANGEEINGYNTGAVRVLEYDGSDWSNLAAIEGEFDLDFSGNSISLSTDGKFVAIGASRSVNDNGSVRIMDICGIESASQVPSKMPSSKPSNYPSMLPSSKPSINPSNIPSSIPSMTPSKIPSSKPSIYSSEMPSSKPSALPSEMPSSKPSALPSEMPSSKPSAFPSKMPSSKPSTIHSQTPSSEPSKMPSVYPSKMPSLLPTSKPSSMSSSEPSFTPSTQYSFMPSSRPSSKKTAGFSSTPSTFSTTEPSIQATNGIGSCDGFNIWKVIVSLFCSVMDILFGWIKS